MKLTKEQEKFMKENFKAGEYSVLTIMVKNDELETLIEVLKVTGLNLAIIPQVQSMIDFANIEKKGSEN